VSKILTACTILATLLAASIGATPSAARPNAGAKPIVTVVEHGGLCRSGECRTVFRITDTTITGSGYVPRRLAASDRAALLGAIRALRPAYFRAHPFTGMCPTAYDLTESIYRFRGFARPLASCTYDLRGVKAVALTDRLLRKLKPR
jgi:hypothetical protein